MKLPLLALALLPVCGPATPPELDAGSSSDAFSELWHDGRAELDGYRLRVQRYGEERTGEAVMIYVTEPFSERARVKKDEEGRDPGDAVDAFKLNFVRDFQTGVYDYDTMTSLFVRAKDFEPLKVSFSSAEWCGHVYEELVPRGENVEHELRSYFEGESASARLENPPGGVVEANLFVLLRGLRGAYLDEGAKREVPFLAGSFHRRLAHRPAVWTTVEIERNPGVQSVEVGAGAFETIEYVVRVRAEGDGGIERVGRFLVEVPAPHRIVRWAWTRPDGSPYEAAHAGELAGSERMRYWELHGEGDVDVRRRLGL